jgi:hypothetical protein
MSSPNNRRPLSPEQLQAWLDSHKGYAGRKENTRIIPETKDPAGRTLSPSQQVVESVTYEAADGATITVRELEADAPGTYGPHASESGAIYTQVGETPPDRTRDRTPAQTRGDEAVATQQEIKAAQDAKDEAEKDSNSKTPDEFGVVARETNADRAKRVVDRRNAERQQEATRQQIIASQASTAATNARIQQDASKQTSDDVNSAADRALRARQIANQEAKDARDAKKPEFLSTADSKNKTIVRYDPETGQTVTEANPNYDQTKADAEEKRAEIASQISLRQITLEEGKQQYTQWFDSNVRTPLMIAQEARAKAEEKRQALEAEERRRQFAADYSLRKATLGQQAGQDASQNEISLLPYRSGPTWGADISSAINSLGAGGKVNGPDAGAGIHFSDSSFAFDRPNFKKIAAEATKQVLGGLTDYRPSDQQFETADYSGVPPVNTSGMPAYTFGGGASAAPPSALPPPSPEYTQ